MTLIQVALCVVLWLLAGLILAPVAVKLIKRGRV